jgi:hypothetical protein
MREMIHACKMPLGKPEWKTPLAKPRCRCQDNIKMDLKEIGCEIVYMIHLVLDKDLQWALVNTVTNLRVP